MSNNYAKAISYYRQFGIKVMLLKIIGKLLKRDFVYEAWYKRNCPTEEELNAQRKYKFPYQPKISIAIPLYKTPQKYLDDLVASVKAQTYSNWELCLSDGSGQDSPLFEKLKQFEADDDRIKVIYNKQPLHISENTNEALKIASGDFIAFADHDDLLAPNLLYECVQELNKDLSIEIIYTDEDKIDMKGKEHFAPHFKPDFNIDLLRSGNYVCHFFVVKRNIFEKVGLLQPEYDGAQDFDFTLRCVEQSSHIKHIAKILYHWRAHKDSTAENPESKNYAYIAGVNAVKAHYDRVGIKANVEQSRHKGVYRTKNILQQKPFVSIVIIHRDDIDSLDVCLSAIEENNRYTNYEVIVLDDHSIKEDTFKYYKKLICNKKIRIVYCDATIENKSAIRNYGVQYATGEYLLFLSNGIEILNEECIEELLGYCMRHDVGTVGARIYNEDGTVQHAGVIVGLNGSAGNAFEGCFAGVPGYFGRIEMAQNYSAVSANCMMIKKTVFEQVQGFSESYQEQFEDIDLCLRLIKKGYRIVYNPYAEVKSHNYLKQENVFDEELFIDKWDEFLQEGDPCYNPNFALDRYGFGLKI